MDVSTEQSFPRNNAGDSSETTRIFSGIEETTAIRVQTISGALERLDICDDSDGTVALARFDPVRNAVCDASNNRKIDVRFIAEVTSKNVDTCKELMHFVNLRHLDNLRGNFVVTEGEYYSFTTIGESSLPDQTIYSKLPSIVEEQQYLFETLWNIAVPAEQKVLEIEMGIHPPKIQILQNPSEIERMFVALVEQAKEEILFVFPTTEAFRREETIGVIASLDDAVRRGAKVKVMTPVNEHVYQKLNEYVTGGERPKAGAGLDGSFDFRIIERKVTQNTVTILVVDRKVSFIIEQKDNSREYFSEAIGHATYSTSKPNVTSHVLFFETLWFESDLKFKEAHARQQEGRARRQSELLQDILTHDMRNYNQVTKFSAELLREELKENQTVKGIVDEMLKSVAGSTLLLERAKELGKVLSERNVQLHSMRVLDILSSSISIVKLAHPEKRLIDMISTHTVSEDHGPEVMADDLLTEVFSNLFDNSVKYTVGSEVPLEVLIEDAFLDAVDETKLATNRSKLPQFRPAIRVSILDKATGIPDEMKERLFSRYLKGSMGTGLGMSIVHALTVERYHGKINISDRVQGDYSKGTRIEIFLPKAG